jgi:hypothetical protein
VNLGVLWGFVCKTSFLFLSHEDTKFTKGHEGTFFFVNLWVHCGFVRQTSFLFLHTKTLSSRRFTKVFLLSGSWCSLWLCAEILFFFHTKTLSSRRFTKVFLLSGSLGALWLCVEILFFLSHEDTKYTKGHEGTFFLVDLWVLCGFVC